ncbi:MULTISPECIES: 8-amino-7-oxononanoate synthase [unclassified Herbaspirillum]|uniref:8-amino-7-oxononanoate synthase n=1 Tax=unclassified Herbaspirillum TaxID=2624150 RepID=UPI00114F13E7|nr:MULTISPECIES: 8-amino-7-oxononanoate synthase [unclassified Herbaspirillum]MBB5393269.1 8-amino-7-oxononanoate synthase [Herbaspirillum sp. SJZ102]TQK03982.1 8-amino-7-oxononanoate synthase [Herbaspirillum sp. SJZ130]TQK08714.1 8-amino-7-oxononanoate synthase [Herbaspirillum sp. SJZ106]TWC71985.1 8-amino-7-oxononanoate synthase [Herbaspirillum sp. SJZ099]
MSANHFSQSLSELAAQGLRRTRRVVDGPQGPILEVDGVPYLSFCSNDYLGLASHPGIIDATISAAQRYGVGAAASALISGHARAHETLERELADFVGMPRALYFSNGYMANIGAITALVGAGDAVFLDRLSHASLIDGARLSRADFSVYPHHDVARLEHLLAKCRSPRKLVVTDAVFSMDGDLAPLAELTAICERHGAWLLVDDAHGFGVLGPQGRGSLQHLGLQSDCLVYMGTLGKAAGVAGAFVAGPAELVEWLMQRARTYMFTTANPAMMASAVSASLTLIGRDEWRRECLREGAAYLRQRLAPLPWKLLPSSTAIQPLIVGDNKGARDLMDFLRSRGIWAPAICPPTVPKGTARLRISLSAVHTEQQLEQLAEALLHAASALVGEAA